MRTTILFLLFLPLFLIGQSRHIPNSVNQFAMDACQQFSDTSDYLLSPASISIAMGMTYLGAGSTTKEEIKEVFHYPDDQLFYSDFPKFINIFRGSTDNTTISLANKLWIGNGRIDLHEQFVKDNTDYFNSEIETIDFDDPEIASDIMNQWVASETAEKITDLIDPSLVTHDAVMFLINAIYFKSNWAMPFDKDFTQKGNFYNHENDKVEVDFMINSGQYYKSYANRHVDIVELPYADGEFSFVIMLPKTYMKSLESELTFDNYRMWMMSLQRTQFERLQVPKFKSGSKLKLKETLIKMGMPKAFGGADFTAMGNAAGQIRLSAVVHETFMEFNEEGTEASAATAVGASARSMPPPPKIFIADRPFIYILRHRQSNTILFIGKMSNPKY